MRAQLEPCADASGGDESTSLVGARSSLSPLSSVHTLDGPAAATLDVLSSQSGVLTLMMGWLESRGLRGMGLKGKGLLVHTTVDEEGVCSPGTGEGNLLGLGWLD